MLQTASYTVTRGFLRSSSAPGHAQFNAWTSLVVFGRATLALIGAEWGTYSIPPSGAPRAKARA